MEQLGGGARISEEFQYIDPKPLASASVAQVHRAKLRTGEEVVLKVRDGALPWTGWCNMDKHRCTRVRGFPVSLRVL